LGTGVGGVSEKFYGVNTPLWEGVDNSLTGWPRRSRRYGSQRRHAGISGAGSIGKHCRHMYSSMHVEALGTRAKRSRCSLEWLRSVHQGIGQLAAAIRFR